jgi:hypothetical protein
MIGDPLDVLFGLVGLLAVLTALVVPVVGPMLRKRGFI